MSCNAWAVTSKGQQEGKITKERVCMCVRPFVYLSLNLCCERTSPGTCTHTHTYTRIKNHFPPVPDRSHVDCVSIRGQEWLVISQGSDSQNGPSGTLCHSARVRACPIDPAQLSKPMRDARLRSSRDGLCCQELWMMYNIRMVFVL